MKTIKLTPSAVKWLDTHLRELMPNMYIGSDEENWVAQILEQLDGPYTKDTDE